mmetsp:Transcript_44670/g.143090  ORF Transcript_44670/g.143090 Transcript_44670/m.143090 type:complete len:201 (+) Transcript_44670:333-935(+)
MYEAGVKEQQTVGRHVRLHHLRLELRQLMLRHPHMLPAHGVVFPAPLPGVDLSVGARHENRTCISFLHSAGRVDALHGEAQRVVMPLVLVQPRRRTLLRQRLRQQHGVEGDDELRGGHLEGSSERLLHLGRHPWYPSEVALGQAVCSHDAAVARREPPRGPVAQPQLRHHAPCGSPEELQEGCAAGVAEGVSQHSVPLLL